MALGADTHTQTHTHRHTHTHTRREVISRNQAHAWFKNVCDSVFKCLHNKGIGTDTKVTPVLSLNEEDVLWKEGIISLDNPTGLLNAMFFYNDKKLLP